MPLIRFSGLSYLVLAKYPHIPVIGLLRNSVDGRPNIQQHYGASNPILRGAMATRHLRRRARLGGPRYEQRMLHVVLYLGAFCIVGNVNIQVI